MESNTPYRGMPQLARGGSFRGRRHSWSAIQPLNAVEEPKFQIPSAKDCGKKFLSYIYFLTWIRTYEFKEIHRDLLAGLTVGVMAVPQAMSYATVAGLPPIFGLYNAFMGLLPYAFFGTSPHLISGPTAVMSILVAGVIPSHPADSSLDTSMGVCDTDSGNLEGCHVRIAMALTISMLAGFLQLLMGLGGLGFLVDLISEPIILGFTTGSAFLIASTQITNILGISKCKGTESCVHHLQLVDSIENIFLKLDDINWPTVGFSVVAVCFLVVFKKGLGKVLPSRFKLLANLGPLICMVTAILVMRETGADPDGSKVNSWGMKVVGSVCSVEPGSSPFHTQCLPPIRWPLTYAKSIYSLRGGDVVMMFGAAVAVALVGYMESMTIAKTVAKQRAADMGREAPIDASKEFVALGLCNLICSQFSGYPVTGSFSRTAVNADSGARSPIAALTAACVVGTALLMLTPVLKYIPKAALASIVVVSVIKLVHIHEAVFLWRVSRRDCYGFILIVISTLLLGVEPALIIGILTSWVLLLAHKNKTQVVLLGRESGPASSAINTRMRDVAGDGVVVDLAREFLRENLSQDDSSSHHVAILRLTQDMTFDNAGFFKDTIEILKDNTDLAAVVFDCANVNDIDASGLQALRTVSADLRRNNVLLMLCQVDEHPKEILEKAVQHDKKLQAGISRWALFLDTDEEGGVSEAINQEERPALIVLQDLDVAVGMAKSVAHDTVVPDNRWSTVTISEVLKNGPVKLVAGPREWST